MSTEIANLNIKSEKFANSNTKLEEKIGLITGGNSASAEKASTWLYRLIWADSSICSLLRSFRLGHAKEGRKGKS